MYLYRVTFVHSYEVGRHTCMNKSWLVPKIGTLYTNGELQNMATHE